jgi:catechol 2,3-dioxygenase-like lactoylglutathione lyase family enzyme
VTVRRIVVDHVSVVVSDFSASLAFYTAALEPLGFSVLRNEGGYAGFGVDDLDDFGIDTAIPEAPPSSGVHIAFVAESRDAVQQFYDAALAAGGVSRNPPGTFLEYSPRYYAAFVSDPDGHNIEAVFHEPA